MYQSDKTVASMQQYVQSRTTDELKLEFLMYKDHNDIYVELLALEMDKRKRAMGKIKNIATEIQEQGVYDQIDPTEWDMAFPKTPSDEYMNYMIREYDTYLQQKSEFDL